MPSALALRGGRTDRCTAGGTDCGTLDDAQARDQGPGHRAAGRAESGTAQRITRRLVRAPSKGYGGGEAHRHE